MTASPPRPPQEAQTAEESAFYEYVRYNLRAGSVIGKPDWWAERLWRASGARELVAALRTEREGREKAERERDAAISDAERGFAKGAYARLHELQSAEYERDALRTALQSADAELAGMSAKCSQQFFYEGIQSARAILRAATTPTGAPNG